MISIHSFMLLSLGFLVALLLALLVAPAYRRRAVRLTTEDLKRSMPLTEAEIRADKDRIRAEYAIRLHEFERKLEGATLDAARQSVEINRRDAQISALEGEIGRLKTSLDEHENARRVLEHTVMDRLPKVEHRLAEAKKLLFQRDREITVLTQSAEKQARALDEATQINTQQRDEIHRLNAAITTRVARNREGLGDPKFDGEVALRSEIEALRAKSRDQAQLIARLQALLGRAGVAVAGLGPVAGKEAQASDAEIERLRSNLAEAESALRSVQREPAGGTSPQLEAELRAAKSDNQDKAAEIARLKAALNAYETDERGEASKDSKIALKARVSSLEVESEQNAATIQQLRTEVVAANERLARQAAHFREEMRRLGAGTLPASLDPRRQAYEPPQQARRSLSDRINEPRVRTAVGSGAEDGTGAQQAAAVPADAPASADSGDKAAKRPRLLERISSAEKSG